MITWPELQSEDRVVVAGEMETTIGRMELLGLVIGLRYLYWLHNETSGRENDPGWAERMRPENLEVSAITDSKFLEMAATGQNGRKAALDLWKGFDQLGSRFGALTVEHRPRNTLPQMCEADRVAGLTRKRLISGEGRLRRHLIAFRMIYMAFSCGSSCNRFI